MGPFAVHCTYSMYLAGIFCTTFELILNTVMREFEDRTDLVTDGQAVKTQSAHGLLFAAQRYCALFLVSRRRRRHYAGGILAAALHTLGPFPYFPPVIVLFNRVSRKGSCLMDPVVGPQHFRGRADRG